MIRTGLGFVALAVLALNNGINQKSGASEADARATRAQMVEITRAIVRPAAPPAETAFMLVLNEALPPLGHVSFCQRHPHDCRANAGNNEPVVLGANGLRELKRINDRVNRAVQPATDQELYGRVEHWDYPAAKGDCEDYVLLKQRMLVERGWPLGALLITVVRDENGEGHAVLTVRTDAGDLILDNKRPEVLPWTASPYTFIKRQSHTNPRVWLSLAAPDDSVARLSGTKNH